MNEGKSNEMLLRRLKRGRVYYFIAINRRSFVIYKGKQKQKARTSLHTSLSISIFLSFFFESSDV